MHQWTEAVKDNEHWKNLEKWYVLCVKWNKLYYRWNNNRNYQFLLYCMLHQFGLLLLSVRVSCSIVYPNHAFAFWSIIITKKNNIILCTTLCIIILYADLFITLWWQNKPFTRQSPPFLFLHHGALFPVDTHPQGHVQPILYPWTAPFLHTSPWSQFPVRRSRFGKLLGHGCCWHLSLCLNIKDIILIVMSNQIICLKKFSKYGFNFNHTNRTIISKPALVARAFRISSFINKTVSMITTSLICASIWKF